jgi:hypothetical protein
MMDILSSNNVLVLMKSIITYVIWIIFNTKSIYRIGFKSCLWVIDFCTFYQRVFKDAFCFLFWVNDAQGRCVYSVWAHFWLVSNFCSWYWKTLMFSYLIKSLILRIFLFKNLHIFFSSAGGYEVITWFIVRSIVFNWREPSFISLSDYLRIVLLFYFVSY